MNKYSSGYTAISIISFLGWIVIIVSIIGGAVIGLGADRGMGFVGLVVAGAGVVQGLLLLGVGTLGLSILDGSIAQQSILKILEGEGSENNFKASGAIPSAKNYSDGSNLIKSTSPSTVKRHIKNYKGIEITRGQDGVYIEENKFANVLEAEKWVNQKAREALLHSSGRS